MAQRAGHKLGSSVRGADYVKIIDTSDLTDGIEGTEKVVLSTSIEQSINVLNYGAVAGGSATINTTAIKAAINAADGGGTVIIPGGTYNVNSMGFSSISNVTILGLGLPKLVSAAPGATEPDRSVFNFISNCTDITIDGIEIDGDYDSHLSTLPANTNNHCIAIGFYDKHTLEVIGCKRFRITNCYLHSSGWQKAGVDKFGDNISISAADDVWVENCVFENPGRWHISAGWGSRHTIKDNLFFIDTATRNYALGTLDWEYNSLVGGDHLIQGNTALGMPRMQFSSNGSLVGIKVLDNTLNAEDVTGAVAASTPAANRGIAVAGLNVVDIRGNTVLNCDSSGSILVDPNSVSISDISISDNQCDGAVSGLRLSTGTCENLHIADNKLRSTGASSPALDAQVSGYSDVHISDNRIESTLTWPARIESVETMCVNNKFISGVGTDVSFHCTTNSTFAGNSCNDDYRFTSITGATGGLVGINRGGISVSGDALASLEGTDAVVPVFA